MLGEINERVKVGERVLVTVLTKRMAEQLTEFLADHGVKVRYLHSDIDTVERVEIIRDLRLGTFDVLVGINLLREGLDIPEVSLVAILDADKEGFLRAERSLIQTIGRAARNVNGKAILYGDKITDSMSRAIGETERRRDKQIAHNLAMGITPRGVTKRIKDIIDGVYNVDDARAELKEAQTRAKFEDMSEKQISKEIKRLEKQMMDHAKNLEFEKAAQTRDQLSLLRQRVFGANVGRSHYGYQLNCTGFQRQDAAARKGSPRFFRVEIPARNVFRHLKNPAGTRLVDRDQIVRLHRSMLNSLLIENGSY